MKTIRWFVMALFVLCGTSAYALEPPAHTGWIVDRAHLLRSGEKSELERALKRIQTSTGGVGKGAQVAVLTIPTLEGDDIKDFSNRTARRWGLGAKGFGSDGKSNGLLILIVYNKNSQERLIRLEVGNGLQGSLPDGKVGELSRSLGTAVNRGDKLAKPLGEMIEELASIIYKEYNVTPSQSVPSETRQGSNIDILYVMLGITIMLAGILGAIFHRRKRRLRYWFGGLLGGSSWYGIMYLFSENELILIGITIAGYILGYLLSAMFRNGGDALDIWPRYGYGPSYSGDGTDLGGHRGSGGDFDGGGADSTFTGDLMDGISNMSPPSDCNIGGCDPGGCDVGGCG